jgi:hypothetical protein
VRREDVEAFFLHRFGATEFGIGIVEHRVVEARIARIAFLYVQVGGKVLRDESVEQHAEHVGLEVPSVHAAAQIVGDTPDGLVEFSAFGFSIVIHDPNFLSKSYRFPLVFLVGLCAE